MSNFVIILYFCENSHGNCRIRHVRLLRKKRLMKGLHTYMKVEQYIEQLESKGFQLGEDGKGFIFFGKEMTNAPDELVNAAIELTLKSKITFDGSFFISLLESMMSQEIQSRKDALRFADEYKLLV